ncbi:MAG: hypothetical protein IT353_03415 [Gemmatimonadaceae bacterium]|nr:hypothetical protein [Gemmatimonadaceae bacterium]
MRKAITLVARAAQLPSVTVSRIARFGAALGVLLSPQSAWSQTITPRTVPVQMSQQFNVLPSDRAAMGNVSIALDDPILDAFVNPAKATRVRSGFVSIAPYFYSQTDARGGGKSFPVSGVGTLGDWAFGGLFALQQLDRTRLNWNAPLSEQTAANQYLSALLARRLGNGYAIGASAYVASLEAAQGIDQLYAGSDRILQEGSSRDVRLGLTRQWGEGRTFEAIVLHNDFDMTHDVHYPIQFVSFAPTPVAAHTDVNRDHTTRWGVHTEYVMPVGTQGWSLGVLGTVNRLSHPKIPDYRIGQVITVPRDPGHTTAFNAGLGMSRVLGKAMFGFDVILEPISSTTWAEAARDTLSRSGVVIPRGGHTVDNRFRFNNSLMRFGFERMAPANDTATHLGFQLGLGVNAIRYRLWQTDRVRDSSRIQNERWMEWSPSVGLKLRSPGYEIHYTLAITCGAGARCMPSSNQTSDDVLFASPNSGGVIAAPTAALRFNGGRVTTQRLAFSFRIR